MREARDHEPAARLAMRHGRESMLRLADRARRRH